MSVGDYGTFVDSLYAEKTELRAVADQTGGINEMEHSFLQSSYSHVYRQNTTPRNRLPLLWHEFLRWISNIGLACILICLHLSIIGLFMSSLAAYEESTLLCHIAQFLFSCGTFGFSGGCINYLAVTLFFKKIPCLYGSGIVYRRYQDICESVRNSVINTFFDETFLQMYIKQKLNQHIIRLNLEGHLQRILQSEMVDQLISTELHSLAMSPEGQFLSSAGINVVSLRPLVKPYIDQGIQRLKQELRMYTTQWKEDISSKRVDRLIKDMMFGHLSLLVVLGCIVGILLGILSRITGVGVIIE
ncbi:hypothetical protein P5673_006538 [Acropora cervicornis]|uniref:Uncharacterized protein n=1 Tax=Acropora cervicornis TaxID=6130 RepID=A0AAD9QWU6_ACRCE|nr:hypothetical protein P5673_006538 [Acropora cervicornis]